MTKPASPLIQHARGSRYEVTRATGSIVFSKAPSYIVVLQGNFRTRRPSAAWSHTPSDKQFVSYPLQTVVIDIETGQITAAAHLISAHAKVLVLDRSRSERI